MRRVLTIGVVVLVAFARMTSANAHGSEISPTSDRRDLASPSRVSTHEDDGRVADVVLLDSQIEGAAAVARSVRSEAKLFVYDGRFVSATSVLSNVRSWAIGGDRKIRTLSLIAHGAPGTFQLGRDWISTNTFEATADAWNRLRDALAPGATIDLFGCNVAARGSSGQVLIEKIARITRTQVYASKDLTGVGGNWRLEASSRTTEPATSVGPHGPFDLGALASAPATLAWYGSGWLYRKQVVIDHTKVSGGADLSNFPVLVSLASDANLASNAQASGNDILFASADGTTKLSHEIERYTSATGALVAWVKVPTLQFAADTVLYLYYGNPSATSQQDAANTWDNNYKAVWHFRENSGTSLGDATANANTGTLSGASRRPTWWDAGKIGPALSFDGVDDRLIIPNSASLNISGVGLTISAWLNFPDTESADYVIFGKFYNADMSWPYYQYGLEFDAVGGSKTMDLYLGSNGNLLGPFRFAGIIGAWAHTTFTYDGTNVKGYMNGVLASTTPETASITATTRQLRIGLDNNDNQPYQGLIDELRVSNIARSAGWIATEYANQNSPATFLSLGAQTLSPAMQFFRRRLED